KPDIVCGQLKVAHQKIDLKNWKTNQKNAGYTPEERAALSRLLDYGFIDTFRYFYPPQEGVYSWWNYRFNSRKHYAGCPIEYF
ncbi:exodeoxyribonuclease III, partial [Enterococcus faecium]